MQGRTRHGWRHFWWHPLWGPSAPMAAIICASAGALYIIGVPQVDAGSTAFGRVTRFDRDCADFSTQAEAQAFFQSEGSGDPHGLDPDGDGRACGADK